MPTERVKRNTRDRIKQKRSDDYTHLILEIEKKKIEILTTKKMQTIEKRKLRMNNHNYVFKHCYHTNRKSTSKFFHFREVVQQFAYPVNYHTDPLITRNIIVYSSTSTSLQNTPIDHNNNVHGTEGYIGLLQYLNLK